MGGERTGFEDVFCATKLNSAHRWQSDVHPVEALCWKGFCEYAWRFRHSWIYRLKWQVRIFLPEWGSSADESVLSTRSSKLSGIGAQGTPCLQQKKTRNLDMKPCKRYDSSGHSLSHALRTFIPANHRKHFPVFAMISFVPTAAAGECQCCPCVSTYIALFLGLYVEGHFEETYEAVWRAQGRH